MDWKALHTAKQAEIDQLARVPLSEVTPSIRDFAHSVTTHKQELALVAALKRADPQTGRSWSDRDLVALAQECDDAEVGALGVYTEPAAFGASMEDLRAIAAVVSAPVLRLDLILHPHQIHHARLCGADAVLLDAGAVDRETLASLVTVASSVHVASVVSVQTQAELEQALAAGASMLGLTSPSGKLDMTQLTELLTLIPSQKTVIALNEISTAGEYTALEGKVDAALVSSVILDASDVGAVLTNLSRQ